MAESREIPRSGRLRSRSWQRAVRNAPAHSGLCPRVDIYETSEAIAVIADMPGVDAGSVDITLEQNVLTINGYVNEKRPEGYTPASHSDARILSCGHEMR